MKFEIITDFPRKKNTLIVCWPRLFDSTSNRKVEQDEVATLCKGACDPRQGGACRNEKKRANLKSPPSDGWRPKEKRRKNWRCSPAQGCYQRCRRNRRKRRRVPMREKLEVIRQYFDERILITTQKNQSRVAAVSRRPRTAYAQSGRTPRKTLLNIVSQQPHKKSPRRASQNSYADTRTGTTGTRPSDIHALLERARAVESLGTTMRESCGATIAP